MRRTDVSKVVDKGIDICKRHRNGVLEKWEKLKREVSKRGV